LKNSILQNITATTISILVKKTLDTAFKNTKKLKTATIYRNLVQIVLKTRGIAAEKI